MLIGLAVLSLFGLWGAVILFGWFSSLGKRTWVFLIFQNVFIALLFWGIVALLGLHR